MTCGGGFWRWRGGGGGSGNRCEDCRSLTPRDTCTPSPHSLTRSGGLRGWGVEGLGGWGIGGLKGWGVGGLGGWGELGDWKG